METNEKKVFKTRGISIALIVFAILCFIVSLGISGCFDDYSWHVWNFYSDFLDYLIFPQGAEGIAVFFWLAVLSVVASIVFWNKKIDNIYCKISTHIVLCLFTLGIWYCIWIYRITKYLNEKSTLEKNNPKSELLLCIFIPLYQVFWYYKQGQKIESLMKQKRIYNLDMSMIFLILGIFIPILACVLMQDKINAIINNRVSSNTTNDAEEINTVADQLKKFKDLLDSGVITQEEFDAKKKQLLGL